MTLIHGLGSKASCPICLIPRDQLTNLSETFEQCTKENMWKIYKDAKELNAMDKEELLETFGLQEVKVC
jgi:hypothetical protein